MPTFQKNHTIERKRHEHVERKTVLVLSGLRKGPDGYFIYKGVSYRIRPGTDFRRYSGPNCAWVLGMVVCFVFCGWLPTGSLQIAYVTVPFLCGMLPVAACAWDVGNLAFSKQRLPQLDQEK